MVFDCKPTAVADREISPTIPLGRTMTNPLPWNTFFFGCWKLDKSSVHPFPTPTISPFPEILK